MTLITDGYVIADNEPLNHARILWNARPGEAVGDGTGAALALNDYTAQRWVTQGPGEWLLTFSGVALVDTVFLAAHNLAGRHVSVLTSGTLTGGFTLRGEFTPPDNTPIMVMATFLSGAAITARRCLIVVDGAATVGIIRAGLALQLPQPIYGGHAPGLWNRVTEGQQAFSETGQWLGRTVRRVAYRTTYSWRHIPAGFYKEQFEPFARTLPAKPFAIAGNPARMEHDVLWAWATGDVRVTNMGIRNLVSIDMDVIGYAG